MSKKFRRMYKKEERINEGSGEKGQERISKDALKMIAHSMENFDKAVPITRKTNAKKIKEIFDKFGIEEDIYVF